ncbi:glycosyltransferase family 2 protein [Amycolatopsis sp. CA-161197]|uniref:glycosyltransferase family 2 protein n=1 Tax=unclassified Amycolatopsis TaxID=2618356 RepID=UPI0036CE77CA
MTVVFWVLTLLSVWSSGQGFVLLALARKPVPPPPSGPRRRVSVLVPCFNEAKVLRKTIDAILASRGVELDRVICVDDGSTDATRAVMREAVAHYGDVILVLGQRNLGKAAALNRGLTAVTTEFFVSVDADTQVLPDTLARLLGHFADPRVAAVSGQMIVGNRRPAQDFVYAAQVHEYETANNIERRAFSRMRRITVIPGAIGAFRRRAVAAVGGYPEGTLAEDAHLTLALLLAGHRTVHEASAAVLTEAPDTMASLRRQRVRWATGKTQVLLRIAWPALRRGGIAAMLWLYLLWNNSVLPLVSVPSAVLLPLSAVVLLLRGDDLPEVVAVAVLTIVVNYGYFVVSRRFARSLDAAGRAAAGLVAARTSFRSTVVIPVVGSWATWIAWARIVTGRRGAWDKLDRSGDVQVQPVGVLDAD